MAHGRARNGPSASARGTAANAQRRFASQTPREAQTGPGGNGNPQAAPAYPMRKNMCRSQSRRASDCSVAALKLVGSLRRPE